MVDIKRYEQFKNALTLYGVYGTDVKIQPKNEEETQKLFETSLRIYNEYRCYSRYERLLPEFVTCDSLAELFLIRTNTEIKIEYAGMLKEEGWGDYLNPSVYKITLRNKKYEYAFNYIRQRTATTHRVKPSPRNVLPKMLKEEHKEAVLKLFSLEEIEELKELR